MSKIKISEEKLQSLISECVQEIINESLESEGIGNFLGNAYQWGRNKVNNFKKDFVVGRLHQRAKNVNYNPLASYRKKYGDEHVKNMLNQRGDMYGQNRLNTMINAYNGTFMGGDNAPRANTELAMDSVNQQPNVGPNNNRDRSDLVAQSKQQMQQAAKFLKDNGHEFVNGQWIYTKDGSNWPALKSQYKAIRNAAQKYNIASKGVNGVYESKIRKIVSESLKEYLNEIGDTAAGQEKLGRLSARRFNQASDEKQKAYNAENPEDEKKHLDKKHNLMQRSIAAYDKAAKERDEHPGLKHYHGNAFNGGEQKERKKARK